MVKEVLKTYADWMRSLKPPKLRSLWPLLAFSLAGFLSAFMFSKHPAEEVWLLTLVWGVAPLAVSFFVGAGVGALVYRPRKKVKE